jgi:hypothetical protein
MSQSDNKQDPFLDELLDEVLRPHAGLPPEVLAEMRAVLRDIAIAHPVGSIVADRARPRKPPATSGEQESPVSRRSAGEVVPSKKKVEGA